MRNDLTERAPRRTPSERNRELKAEARARRDARLAHNLRELDAAVRARRVDSLTWYPKAAGRHARVFANLIPYDYWPSSGRWRRSLRRDGPAKPGGIEALIHDANTVP